MIKPENMPIRDRILALAKKFGIEDIKRGGRLARHLGVPNSVIYRLLDNFSLPGADNLKKICENAGVSADYILFGQEHFLQTTEHQEFIYDARPLAPVEADLMNQIMTMVDEVIKDEKKPLQSEQKALLITRVYNDCAEDRIKPNIIMVKRYLWLLA